MTLRYVVLHHTGVASPHFDFLYEAEPGAALTSFRCPRWPPRVGDVLDEMPDHRRAYLDDEGEIAGGRGVVRRVETGHVESLDLTADPPAFALALSGSGQIVLTHHFEPGDNRATRWTVTAVAS